MSEWSTGGLMSLHSFQNFQVMAAPALGEGVELAGYAMQTVCPMGCVHLLAYEAELSDTLELSLARLEAAKMGGLGFLLLLHPVPRTKHVEFCRNRDAAAAHWRGVVQ